MTERKARTVSGAVLLTALLWTACQGSGSTARPDDRTLILGWLTCEECIAGERDSVRAIGAPAVSILAAVLDSVPALIVEPLRIRLTNRWTPEFHPDRDTYVNTYVQNAETIARMRAAYSLGDLRAEPELQTALNLAIARGYDADVIQVIRGALAAAAGTGSAARQVRVEPETLSLPVGSSNKLAAFVEDSAGNLLNPDVVWSSSNSAVVSVAVDGRLTGVTIGQAVISAAAVNTVISDSALVTVPAGPAGTTLILQIAAGNHQSAATGAFVPDTLRVVVVTSGGSPASGVDVEWKVLLGAGTLTPVGATTTNSAGIASATWKLGPASGPQRVEARVSGAPAVVFRATAQQP
jgi:hypothetical protein